MNGRAEGFALALGDVPDGAFFAMAEEMGIDFDDDGDDFDWIEGEGFTLFGPEPRGGYPWRLRRKWKKRRSASKCRKRRAKLLAWRGK